MTPKFYAVTWALFGLFSALIWLTGLMTAPVLVSLGFVTFGLVFTGMMCVLPGTVSHPTTRSVPEPPRHVRPEAVSKPIEAKTASAPAFRFRPI